jgi:gas vesicle protein
VGPFLFGIVLGAVAGVLFAPARGEVTRRRLGRQVGELRDLAEERLDKLAGPAEADESDDDASAREELEDRLRRARRRRRIERTARGRTPTPEEEDEPVA